MTLPPFPSYTLQKALFKPLHELYSKYSNVKFYDCLDNFCHNFASIKHINNYSVSPADFHPGSATNKFYSDYIVEIFEKEYPDVIGKNFGKDLNNYDILINDFLPCGIELKEIDRTPQSATYKFEYPSEKKTYKWNKYTFNSYFLNYPLGKDYIKLSFAQPIDLKSIEITGNDVENIELYYTRINDDLNYDDQTIFPFASPLFGNFWNDDKPDLVTSLCVHSDCINDDGFDITIRITKSQD